MYLGTIQTDLFLLLHLRSLIPLHTVLYYLQLPLDSPAFLMPLLRINGRLHNILRKFYDFVLLHIVNAYPRVEIVPLGLGAPRRRCRRRRSFSGSQSGGSYGVSIFLFLLMEEARNVNEACGHGIVVLVVVSVLAGVEHFKHFPTGLHIHRGHVLGGRATAVAAELLLVRAYF